MTVNLIDDIKKNLVSIFYQRCKERLAHWPRHTLYFLGIVIDLTMHTL